MKAKVGIHSHAKKALENPNQWHTRTHKRVYRTCPTKLNY